METQSGRCCYCQRAFTATGPTAPTLEHKKAKMDGGKDWVGNFAIACRHCNEHRGLQMNQARQAARHLKKAALQAEKAAVPAAPVNGMA